MWQKQNVKIPGTLLKTFKNKHEIKNNSVIITLKNQRWGYLGYKSTFL